MSTSKIGYGLVRALRHYKVSMKEYFFLITIYYHRLQSATIDGISYAENLREMRKNTGWITHLNENHKVDRWRLTDRGHQMLQNIHIYAEDNSPPNEPGL